MWTAAWIVYAAGIILGLLFTDARPLTRIGLALLWPLGPLAFVVTLAILAVASLIAFPMVGIAAGVAAVIVWWLVYGPT